MSILLILLGVHGVAQARYPGNKIAVRPIASQAASRRVCSELCAAGLGGEPCGGSCLRVLPQELPTRTNDSRTTAESQVTRRDACPVLCENRLGYPLCECDPPTKDVPREVDYVQICSFFCVTYGHRVDGCQKCETYQENEEESSQWTNRIGKTTDVDWEAWCLEMCSSGDGGIACNCDILPMNALLDGV